jgi:hypothetical protein
MSKNGAAWEITGLTPRGARDGSRFAPSARAGREAYATGALRGGEARFGAFEAFGAGDSALNPFA